MQLTLTEEQELIKSTAHDLLASRSPLSQARAMAADSRGYSQELWKQMVELGWMGLALPEQYGGLESSFLDLCLLVEELGSFQASTPFVPTVVLCGLPIARFGTDELKNRYLPPIVAGEKVMTYGWMGPDGSWSPSGSSVRAREVDDGFELDGDLLFVPFAHVADDLLVVARREGSDQPTVFAVNGKAHGLSVEPLDTVGNDRPARVTFSRTRVGTGDAVGGVDAGLEVIGHIAALGTAAKCAEMVGGAQRVLDMTIDYAKGRSQFGKAIGSFQAVQHHCANMAMDVLGGRFATYEAIWRLAEGLDADTEVAVAKAWMSEAYRRIVGLGHQVHGAIGFTAEYDLHLFYRHALSTELAFGDTDHHLDSVARQMGL